MLLTIGNSRTIYVCAHRQNVASHLEVPVSALLDNAASGWIRDSMILAWNQRAMRASSLMAMSISPNSCLCSFPGETRSANLKEDGQVRICPTYGQNQGYSHQLPEVKLLVPDPTKPKAEIRG